MINSCKFDVIFLYIMQLLATDLKLSLVTKQQNRYELKNFGMYDQQMYLCPEFVNKIRTAVSLFFLILMDSKFNKYRSHSRYGSKEQ